MRNGIKKHNPPSKASNWIVHTELQEALDPARLNEAISMEAGKGVCWYPIQIIVHLQTSVYAVYVCI